MTPEAIRERIRRKRDALSAGERAAKSEAIWKRLMEVPDFQRASQALFYISFQSEVETGLMRQLARDLGMGVAVPRAYPKEKRLVFFDLGSDEALESGPYGILQPREDSDLMTEMENPGVVLVPGTAFDPQGNRLGWGGGYYDQFLNREGRGLPSIGLAFECQIVENIPAQAHDVPVDWIVTEERTLNCRAART